MMDTLTMFAPYIGLGYVLGSIPTGVILGRLMGHDPRAEGSGNIGASNITRVLGKKAGAATLIADVGKGVAATLIAKQMGEPDAALVAGVMAVVGHCFPIWLKFKGGKGVATAFGVMVVILPAVAAIAALAWFTTLYFTRIPALGSLLAAALFVALPQLEETPFEIHCFTLSIALIILVRHIGNIRTLKGRWTNDKDRKTRR